MTPQTIADITPNGAAVPLSTDPNAQATVIFLTATGTSCRFGDSHVGAARGAKLTNGATVTLPRNDFEQGLWVLSQIYLYAGSGSDSVSITWA